MKKALKRTLAVFLALIMVLSIIPLNVFAKATKKTINQEEAFKADSSVSGSSGMDYILSNLSQTNTDDPASGCSVRDCFVDGKNATVHYTAARNCKLVVAVYDDETNQMLASGMKDVEKDLTSAVVTIDISTMPKYYLVKVFMLDENMASLSSTYTFYEHTSVYEKFMSVTPNDFDKDRIVEFGENDVEESFGALNEDVIRGGYTSSMDIIYDSNNGTYTFENAISDVKNLKVGETFYYEDEAEHEVVLLKVKDITMSGGTVVITEDEDIALDDAFDYMRYDEGIYWDDNTNEVEIGEGIVSHSGVEVIKNEPSFNLDSVNDGEADILTTSDEDSGLDCDNDLIKDSFSIDYPNSVKSKDAKEQKYFSAGYKIKGTIGYTLGASVRLHWDKKIGPDYFEFKVETEHKFDFDLSVSGTLKLNADKVFWSLGGKDKNGNEKGISLGKTGLFKLYVKIYPIMSLSLNVDLLKVTIISTKNTGINSNDGYFSYSDEKKYFDGEPIWSDYDNTKIEFKFGVGIKVEIGRKFGKKDKNGNHKISATLSFNVEVLFFDATLNADKFDKNKHNCKVCFAGDLDFSVDGNASINVKIFSILSGIKNPKIKEHVSNGKLSISFLAFSVSFDVTEMYIGWDSNGKFIHGLGSCPNKKSAVTVFVCDKDDKAIKDVSVKCNSVTKKTDENGKTEFYFTPGTYTLTVTHNGETKTETVTVSEFDKSVTVKFEKYDVTVFVCDEDNKAIKDVSVSGNSITKYTDENGKAVFEFSPGTYTLTVNYNGETKTETVTISKSDQSITVLFESDDSSTDLSNKKVGEIIPFGSYPQSEVTDEETLNGIKSVENNYQWKSYNYYSGTGNNADGNMMPDEGMMYYKDIPYNGNKYRAVQINKYRPECTDNISSSSNSVQYDNGYYIGNIYYFKYEPLNWRVLDPSEGLVMCTTAIDAQAYNDYIIYSNGEFYGNLAKTYYASDWANSSIRQWLNNDFYDTAFTSFEKAQICSTCNENFGEYVSDNNTLDEIFILSSMEISNIKYGFSEEYIPYDIAKQLKSTDYSKCQGCQQSTFTDSYSNSWWRLRSSYYSNGTSLVTCDGYVYYRAPVNIVYGVVPAFKFKSQNQIDLSDKKVGDIIEFGSYPQSEVKDSSIISALETAGKSISWVSYNYYSGTGKYDDGQMKPDESMMYYKDIPYNGNTYRAVQINRYRPYCTGYTSFRNGQEINGYYTGNIYYFKYEPLKWRILDPLEGFVLCNTAIDAQAYNNYIVVSNSEFYGNSSKTYYSSDWANSSLRAWLNNDFYNTAFTSAEKAQIGTTYNENKSAYSSQYDSANTSDKIFPISRIEVVNAKYGFSANSNRADIARQLKSTDYAKCQGCYSETSTSYLGNSWWRLRSYGDSYDVFNVDYDGYADNCEGAGNTTIGIVPAFKLNPKSTIQTASVESSALSLNEAKAEAGKKTSISCSVCKAGNDYILLNVANYTEGFTLSNDNLLYIDQLTADENGTVSTSYIPKYNDETSTTLLIGDFGSGTEAKIISRNNVNIYTAKLMVDGKLYKEIEYNEGQKSISLPAVPKKDGYVGKWESYSLTNGGTVINAVYTAVSVSISNVEVKYKDTASIKPEVKTDGDVEYTVKYETSDPKIVTVDKDGNINTHHKGTANVTCIVLDEVGEVLTKDTKTITVKFSFGQWLIWILLFGFLWY